MVNDIYSNCMELTSQFIMCGNCFRVDMYKGCDFGCIYCFVTNNSLAQRKSWKIANVKTVRGWFTEALDINMTHTLKHELLNRRVPLQLGGMSDPFQYREWEHGATKELLSISKEYNYPISISTKVGDLPDDYFEILDPKIHAFQVSLIGLSENYIKKFELNTSTPQERIAFIRKLKEKGFWVSLRLQPLIDLDEGIALIKEVQDSIDFCTVEHLKVAAAGTERHKTFKLLPEYVERYNLTFVRRGSELEFDVNIKKKNIELIKSETNVKIGCGDNDLHLLSDSLNCCGVDLMPEAFKNWWKCNSMYIMMTGDWDTWCPRNSVTHSLFSTSRIPGETSPIPYVKRYCDRMYNETSTINGCIGQKS